MKKEDVRDFLKLRSKYTKAEWTELEQKIILMEQRKFNEITLDEDDIEKIVKMTMGKLGRDDDEE